MYNRCPRHGYTGVTGCRRCDWNTKRRHGASRRAEHRYTAGIALLAYPTVWLGALLFFGMLAFGAILTANQSNASLQDKALSYMVIGVPLLLPVVIVALWFKPPAPTEPTPVLPGQDIAARQAAVAAIDPYKRPPVGAVGERYDAHSTNVNYTPPATLERAVAGWYGDPWKQARLRFFNGHMWTGHTR